MVGHSLESEKRENLLFRVSVNSCYHLFALSIITFYQSIHCYTYIKIIAFTVSIALQNIFSFMGIYLLIVDLGV